MNAVVCDMADAMLDSTLDAIVEVLGSGVIITCFIINQTLERVHFKVGAVLWCVELIIIYIPTAIICAYAHYFIIH